MSNEVWNPTDVVLKATDLHKSYYRAQEVPVLRGLSLVLRQGDFVSIIGTSGSGKSTLLHLLGGLDVPTAGEIEWHGNRIDNQPQSFRDSYRNEVVGFIFQFYHLLPELSALENVMLPELIRLSAWGYFKERKQVREHAAELLAHVGLAHRMSHRPSELSGGEMQRVAIARALASKPELLLADEPTGNLDFETGRSIMELLLRLSEEMRLTVLMVTHDHQLAERATRRLRLVLGRLEPLDLAAELSVAAG